MTATVSEALSHRMSVRAFLNKPVEDELIVDILDLARRAPSGGNLQPWIVHAVGGAKLSELKAIVAEKFAAEGKTEELEFNSYPKGLWEPMRSRRSEAGRLRYEAFGYDNKDPQGLRDLQERNFDFFGAPVGLFFFLDRRVGAPQWCDLGIYLQSVMLMAVDHGLDTCPQQVWGCWNKTLRKFLDVSEDYLLFCGMSVGYRDPDHPCSAARTSRAPLTDFTTFHGISR